MSFLEVRSVGKSAGPDKGEVVFSGVTPHPPILIPDIGREELEKCSKSRRGLQILSRKLEEAHPEILVLITPHGPVFQDALSVYTSQRYSGNFGEFGASSLKLTVKGYPSLGSRILQEGKSKGIPLIELNEMTFKKWGVSPYLDHAAMVPLYYFQEAGLNVPLVLISIGFLPYQTLFEFGVCVRKAIEEEGKRVAVIASGDLSHRLIPTAPYGYEPLGKEFDQKMMDMLAVHDSEGILKLDKDFIEKIGECGYRPILIMLGATQGLALQREVISYEGPFGVGYGVVTYQTIKKEMEAHYGQA
ncbi:MAG: AmmeMemoRadiSam system protein B [Firmicutes bacterium]|nr:AmmeMemoRadiSam system protein B [Bacillota bacterium]